MQRSRQEKPKTEDYEKNENAEAKKSGGGKIFLIIAIVVAALALVYVILNKSAIFQKGVPESSKPSPQKPFKNSSGEFIVKNLHFGKSFKGNVGGEYVARLYIQGVIQEANEKYNQEWLLSTIEGLKDDPYNLGILLVVDSPGGTVYESDEAYLVLREYKKSGKPIWAYFESLAASGGYYISCAADTIWANRNTLTGSIGVIAGASVDATGFLEKLGIKTTTFHAGKNKNMLNYDSPLTEEQREIMQSIADDAYEQFTGIVASARQKSIEEIVAIADGRIYTARQAKANGLVDSIGSLEDAQEKFQEKIKKDFEDDSISVEFFDYKYEYDPPFFNKFFRMVSGA
ncbi:MAG: signal peptide peptidase SppA, partial [Treponemataceae bacterium]|nr:signal peptide peptidase SppA [Treponemataceae bacterium]